MVTLAILVRSGACHRFWPVLGTILKQRWQNTCGRPEFASALRLFSSSNAYVKMSLPQHGGEAVPSSPQSTEMIQTTRGMDLTNLIRAGVMIHFTALLAGEV